MKPRYCAIVMLLSMAASTIAGNAAARDYQAQLDWADTHVVSFPVNGGVSRVHVSVGDRVSGGARLVELDTEPFEIRLRQHEAAVAAHEPALTDAKREYEQAKSLYEQTVLSDVELQRMQLAFERARAELAQAEATLRLSRWKLKSAVAVAPWDARVVQRSVETGQMMVDEQRALPLLVLAKDGVMTARALLSPAEISGLRTGQSIRVQIDNNERDAQIITLGMQPEMENGEPRYRLEARFNTTPDDSYRAGQAAVLRLP